MARKIKAMAERKKGANRTQAYSDPASNGWGIKNFNPVRCEGEDNFTIASHMDILRKQQKLLPKLQDKQII